MRESRRTMARHNPDSSAPSTVLPLEVEAGGLRAAAPRSMPVLTRTAVLASSAPAGAMDIAPTVPDAAATMRKKPRSAPPHVNGPDFSIEAARLALNARRVAGVDEAGRGPLAGPVVAAAVVLDMASLPRGLDDSKKLTAAVRDRLFDEIVGSAVVSVASASAAEIDRWNIRQATLLAMTRALAGLAEVPCHAIVDGRDVPVAWMSRGTAVIEGDARSLSIAAASIIAKVTRDRMMRRLCASYPAYGFSRHMGYATAEHRLALDRHGPCPFHRMTFSPIRQGMLDLG